ncbi:hypothetical protein QTP88_010099 [Uroleucon formosanum]
MRIDDEIGKVALPVPVMISRALELFVSSLLIKAGDVTMQKSARTLTLVHLKQCIYSDSRLDFLKELVKSTPDQSEECNDIADSAVIQNNQVSNNDSDEETSSKTIEWHLLNGCACPLTAAEYEWLVTFPTEVSSSPNTIVNLSTMRLLLSMRRYRRQQHPVADSGYCPTVERVCSATLSSTLWFDKLLAMLASVDDHVRYVATCLATEAVLGCADADDDSLTHLIDGLLLTITTTVGLSRAAAVNVFTRVLDVTCNSRRISTVKTFYCHDGDEAGCFTAVPKGRDTKTLLLDKLSDRWLDVVHATVRENKTTVAIDYYDNGLADIVGLWTAVFRLFRFTGFACRNREQFYSELPSLEWLLYRTDTEPLVWLNTIRLFGSSLQRCLDQPMDDWWMARRVAMGERILTGFIRRRLLYFMYKMVSSYGLENDRTRIFLQETVLLAMRSLHAFVGGHNHLLGVDNDGDAASATMIKDVVDCLDSYVKASTLYATDVGFCRWTVRLMCDRDDVTIECLTCALDVADVVPATWPLLDPFASFAELLECVSYEPDVLLDYLISEESNFLSYALRILKTACRDAQCFFQSCGSGLDDAMVLLIRLRLKMLRLHENHVFPYNVMPIAKLIQRCDELYTEIVL